MTVNFICQECVHIRWKALQIECDVVFRLCPLESLKVFVFSLSLSEVFTLGTLILESTISGVYSSRLVTAFYGQMRTDRIGITGP